MKPALENFSGYLRGNLESITSNELIPFGKELEHTKEYLALEQYGEGRSFTVDYDIRATDFMVPPLVLQPVVENAVRYGIGTRTAGGLGIHMIKAYMDSVSYAYEDGKNVLTVRKRLRQE